jgi:hypothetical protein
MRTPHHVREGEEIMRDARRPLKEYPMEIVDLP